VSSRRGSRPAILLLGRRLIACGWYIAVHCRGRRLATRPANRAAQELGLLLLRVGEPIGHWRRSAATRHGCLSRLAHDHWCSLCLGRNDGRRFDRHPLRFRGCALDRNPLRLRPVMRPLLVAALALATILVRVSVEPFAALRPVIAAAAVAALRLALPIAPAAITVAVAVTIAIAIVPARLPVVIAPRAAVVAIAAILTNLLLALPFSETLRLRIEDPGLRLLAANGAVASAALIALVVTGIEAALDCLALRALTMLPLATLLLLAEGHDDAIVVLGMLQVSFGQHRIAGGLSIARERHVFFGDMGRIATDLYVRTVRLIAASERILALAATDIAAATVIAVPAIAVATTTSAVLLSLPHRLPISMFELSSK